MKWLHAEMDPELAFGKMLSVINGKKWGSSKQDEEHAVRCLVLATLQAARCSTSPPDRGQYPIPEYAEFYGERYANKEDLLVGSILGRTITLLAPHGANVPDMFTLGAGPIEKFPTTVDTSGVHVAILVAAIVVGGVTLTVSACELISAASQVIDNELKRSDQTKRLVELQAGAITMELDHARRAEAAGSTLPYTDGEKTIIGALAQQQEIVAKEKNTPIVSPFNGSISTLEGWGTKAVDGVADAGKKVVEGVSSGIESLIPLLGVGFLVMKA